MSNPSSIVFDSEDEILFDNLILEIQKEQPSINDIMEEDILSPTRSAMEEDVSSYDVDQSVDYNIDFYIPPSVTTPFETPVTTPFQTPLTTPFQTPLTTPATTPISTPILTRRSRTRDEGGPIRIRRKSKRIKGDILTGVPMELLPSCPDEVLNIIMSYPPSKRITITPYVFYSYLQQIIMNENLYWVCHIDSIAQSFIDIDLIKFTYSYSQKFLDDIQRCLEQERPQRFFVIPITIKVPGLSHANIIILDNERQVVEYFEPYGNISIEQNKIKVKDEVIDLIPIGIDYDVPSMIKLVMSKFFPKRIGGQYGFTPYTFLNVQDTVDGFQAKGERARLIRDNVIEGGYCMVWSLFYVYIRLSCKNESFQKIIDAMNTKSQKDPIFIERFITKVENELQPQLRNLTSLREVFFESGSILDLFNVSYQKQIDDFILQLVTNYHIHILNKTLTPTLLKEYQNKMSHVNSYSKFNDLYLIAINNLYYIKT